MGRLYVQLANATGVTNGTWVRVPVGVTQAFVTIEGTFAATCHVRASGAAVAPADADNAAPQVGPDITAPTQVVVEGARWVKLHVSAYTSGTVKAYATA